MAVLVALTILSPLLHAPVKTLLGSVLLIVMLASSVFAVLHHRGLLVAILAIGVPLSAFQWLTYAGLLDYRFDFVRIALFLALVIVLLVTQISLILEARKVTGRILLRGLAAYVLIGYLWACLYIVVVGLQPGAIQGLSEPASWGDFVYFSFVTLTTLGFGDIVPVAPPARSLSIAEAVVGQIYIAVVIAKLVSLHGADRTKRPE